MYDLDQLAAVDELSPAPWASLTYWAKGALLACPKGAAGGAREDGREAPARSAGPRGAKRGRAPRAEGALEPVRKLVTDRRTAFADQLCAPSADVRHKSAA